MRLVFFFFFLNICLFWCMFNIMIHKLESRPNFGGTLGSVLNFSAGSYMAATGSDSQLIWKHVRFMFVYSRSWWAGRLEEGLRHDETLLRVLLSFLCTCFLSCIEKENLKSSQYSIIHVSVFTGIFACLSHQLLRGKNWLSDCNCGLYF